MKAIIFHGTLGSPEGNWFPWLQSTLTSKGWDVITPSLPTPENQSLENWILKLKEQVPDFKNTDLLIGHSLGATFILRLLERSLVQPQQAILISTVINNINNTEYDSLNTSFINTPYQWKMIKKNCSNITIFHGDNDPYVPLSQAKTISKNLNQPLHTIKDGGHINAEAGYTKFPEILKQLNG